uniref:peptidoglycan DD-metalloendopeptidase family protein n=1 Tax=Flavobacterium sp. TaxID=239 RepID=UPI00404B043F
MTFIDFLASQTACAVLSKNFSTNDYFAIDLSVKNPELSKFDLTNPLDFQKHIDSKALEFNKKVAFGGYLENRALYNHSAIFQKSNQSERTIHLGIDVWVPAETSIHCALAGKIHSFQNNDDPGDYGPTIILEHAFKQHKFYTLYGHLSKASLQNLQIGQQFEQGDLLAFLGNPSENGHYAPHLHFQIIQDLEGKSGDYPGVCSQNELSKFAENCPNPNLILKLPI